MNLSESLSRSRSSPDFQRAVEDFLASGRSNSRIGFEPGSPPVKVERVLMKLVESWPDLEFERVQIQARSGCEFYRGVATVVTPDETRIVQFEWNCKWRAEQEGWTDAFGFPDQIRAARTFGYDCFRHWDVEAPEAQIPSGWKPVH